MLCVVLSCLELHESDSQGRGRGFESPTLHHSTRGESFLARAFPACLSQAESRGSWQAICGWRAASCASNGALSEPAKCESKGFMSDTIHVYILRCADGSYYVGLTEDLQSRENAHNNGRGSKYTFLRRPVKMVYSESCDSLEKAIGRERQLKRWSRTKKKALIVGDAARLQQPSKRRL